MTQEQIEEYIGAVAAAVTAKRLGTLIQMLDVYADKMLAEASASIADEEGQTAIQAAEAARQAAQSEANAANQRYLATVKALRAAAQ